MEDWQQRVGREKRMTDARAASRLKPRRDEGTGPEMLGQNQQMISHYQN